jgi:hypothetical protein
MTSEWWTDDDALLAAVKEAFREQDDVPPSFVDAGKTAFAWHNIDAELAALTYDSSEDLLAGAAMRAEPAALRCLTFEARNLTIELEIVSDSLHGQVVPAQPGTIELRQADGHVARAEVDGVGYFTSAPVPAGTFRLFYRTAAGESILTDWITL